MKGRTTVVIRGALIAWAVIVTAGQAQAASSWTQVTPATISRQRLSVTVMHAGTVRGEKFQATVAHKLGVAYHFVNPSGWLEDGRFAGQARSFPCRVTATQRGGGTTSYRFHCRPAPSPMPGSTSATSCLLARDRPSHRATSSGSCLRHSFTRRPPATGLTTRLLRQTPRRVDNDLHQLVYSCRHNVP